MRSRCAQRNSSTQATARAARADVRMWQAVHAEANRCGLLLGRMQATSVSTARIARNADSTREGAPNLFDLTESDRPGSATLIGLAPVQKREIGNFEMTKPLRPPPPPHLSDATRAWWKQVTADY